MSELRAGGAALAAVAWVVGCAPAEPRNALVVVWVQSAEAIAPPRCPASSGACFARTFPTSPRAGVAFDALLEGGELAEGLARDGLATAAFLGPALGGDATRLRGFSQDERVADPLDRAMRATAWAEQRGRAPWLLVLELETAEPLAAVREDWASGSTLAIAVGLPDLREKGRSALRDPRLAAVLELSGPGVRPGRIEARASPADVGPTLRDALGLPARPESFAVSLWPMATQRAPLPLRRLHARSGAARAVLLAGWLLLADPGAPPELYDLEADPGRTRDLSGLHPARVAQLSAE